MSCLDILALNIVDAAVRPFSQAQRYALFSSEEKLDPIIEQFVQTFESNFSFFPSLSLTFSSLFSIIGVLFSDT